MRYNPIFFILIGMCLSSTLAYAETVSGDEDIFLFSPESGSVHSAQINDYTNGPHGEVILATTFGLSTYNGSWSTRHINRGNFSAGLMDDYVTAAEYDAEGNLWLGYSGGIQIYNGQYYSVIRDQDLLKSRQIRAFQRWDEDMWIATGNAGVHRYHEGTWTWFAPYSSKEGGPDFYEADSMALDSATDTLLIATPKEGLWAVTLPNDTPEFTKIADHNADCGQLIKVRRDPHGGGIFFNSTCVAHYAPAKGFSVLVQSDELGDNKDRINDVAAGSDGTLYLATDDGIYIWKNNHIIDHMSRFGGFGTSNSIRTIFIDAGNRLWFSTQNEVGFYSGTASVSPKITFQTPTPDQSPAAVISIPDTSPIQTPEQTLQPAAPLSPLDSIVNFLSGFLPFLHPS